MTILTPPEGESHRVTSACAASNGPDACCGLVAASFLMLQRCATRETWSPGPARRGRARTGKQRPGRGRLSSVSHGGLLGCGQSRCATPPSNRRHHDGLREGPGTGRASSIAETGSSSRRKGIRVAFRQPEETLRGTRRGGGCNAPPGPWPSAGGSFGGHGGTVHSFRTRLRGQLCRGLPGEETRCAQATTAPPRLTPRSTR